MRLTPSLATTLGNLFAALQYCVCMEEIIKRDDSLVVSTYMYMKTILALPVTGNPHVQGRSSSQGVASPPKYGLCRIRIRMYMKTILLWPTGRTPNPFKPEQTNGTKLSINVLTSTRHLFRGAFMLTPLVDVGLVWSGSGWRAAV